MAHTPFRKLKSSHRALIYLVIILIAAFISSYLIGGLFTSIVITLAVLSLLWLTKPLWAPEESPTKLYVGLVTTVAIASLGKSTPAIQLYSKLLMRMHVPVADAIPAANKLSDSFPIVMFFVLIALYLITIGTKDRSAMKIHPRNLTEDFPEERFHDQALRFVEILTARLAMIDEETKWDDYFYSPLKAEVEILSARSKSRRIVDLIDGLKNNKSVKVVVLLGDPGSGKSVALRKVSRELMKEFPSTGKIPVYVNLKEWSVDRQWTRERPPTSQEFRAFLLSSLRGHSFFADQFLSTYFDKLVDSGRFFFLLDSFDEIPGVLDVSEDSWLIQHLSAVLTDFFAQQASGRGVLSSRFYRRPALSREQSVVFQIRPFSDLQIHDALLRSNLLREQTVTELFRNRVELIPVARNPFAAALIRSYAEHNGGSLPANQLAMYDNYIQGRLSRSLHELETVSLTPAEVVSGATEIAWAMFETEDIGLEIPLSRLSNMLPKLRIQEITSSLRYAGLARLSANADPKFSFVHRRLNEFFVASHLIRNPAEIALDSIPKDSRYRDALVLFCEVSQFAEAQKIAEFCWAEITKINQDPFRRSASDRVSAVHCLRFLRDGFRARLECITFSDSLARFIAGKVLGSTDLLEAKLALEGTGLLDETWTVLIINDALSLRNAWISETCVNACRHIRKISEELTNTLTSYFWQIPAIAFVKNYREIQFSLSLSEGMSSVSRDCRWRAWDIRLLLVGLICCVVISPVMGVALALVLFVAPIVVDTRRARRLEFFGRMQVALFAFLPFSAFSNHASKLDPDFLLKFVARHVQLQNDLHAMRFVVAPFASTGSVQRPWISALALFVFITIAPISEMFSILYEKRKSSFIVFLGSGLPVGATLYLKHFHPALFSFLVKIITVVFLFIAAPSIGFLVWTYGRKCANLMQDHRKLKEIMRGRAISRQTITVDFCELKSDIYRCRYVSWLRDQKSPADEWPTGRPNIKNDQSSSLLAQLDESWLGLNS